MFQLSQPTTKKEVLTWSRDLTWTTWFSRAPLILTCSIPAGYCALLSNQQRNREFQLRDFEIKNACLEPTFSQTGVEDETLPKKDEVKLEILQDVFMNDLNRKKLDDKNVLVSKDMYDLLMAAMRAKIKEASSDGDK